MILSLPNENGKEIFLLLLLIPIGITGLLLPLLPTMATDVVQIPAKFVIVRSWKMNASVL